jgi:PIN domain nuclease of toxin-antitoxin system
MKYLLDTHTFMWWDSEAHKLPARVKALLDDEANDIVLSVVTVWELAIKSQIGKLELRLPLEQIVTEHLNRNRFQLLEVQLAHVLEVSRLPLHHHDPFDRLLIAQAGSENVPILSGDAIFSKYLVAVIWKEDTTE